MGKDKTNRAPNRTVSLPKGAAQPYTQQNGSIHVQPMKQLLQNMRDGKAEVADVPVPVVRRGMALVRTATSLVSAGTERMVVEFAEKNLLEKARSRPDLVRQMLEKARREGLVSTLQAAFNRLDQSMALGYSSAGVIVEVGEGMEGFAPGDRVACAGGGYAVHAEYAVVPKNLLVKLPDNVDFDSAAFTTLGAIALHGFRLAQPQVGERIAIIGLGLLGLLSVGLARAAGCQVFGVDLSPERVDLAKRMGAHAAVLRPDAESAGQAFTAGQGFDAVLICADARSSDPVTLAGTLARDRAHVVAVGAVGLDLPRKLYYEKELTFLVSRSYGPGRYDPSYEERGQDYPIGYVRWTEGRNLQAVVDLMASGLLDVHPLISHRIPIEQGAEAYALITGKRKEPFLGVLLTYPQAPEETPARRVELRPPVSAAQDQPGIGVLGAGNYALATFLPAIQRVGGVRLEGIASASGLTARHAAKKYGFRFATSQEEEILGAPEIQAVVILTRHNHHARQTLQALRAGKAVYCEKPLALTLEELDEIERALQNEDLPLLMVGFNRRFAPLAQRMKARLEGRAEPLAAHYRVNAGYLPANHWTQDSAVGGGRILGEACHFVDFLTFLVGTPPVSVEARYLPDGGRYHGDNAVLTLTFADGSLGTVSYLANGDRAMPKERVEVFCAGTALVLDDFTRLEVYRGNRREEVRAGGQDKGHAAAWQAFLTALKSGGTPPIPYEQLLSVSRWMIEVSRR